MATPKALETVISIVDRTAAPFVLFEKRLHHALGPVDKLRRSLNRLSRVSGFNMLKKGVSDLRGHTSKVTEGIRNIGMSVDYVGRSIQFGLGKIQEVALRGDDLAKTSRRLGLSVESLQKFRHAAGLAGVPVEQMQESMRKMGVGAVRASQGVAKESMAFKALGISVRNADGSIKDNERLLLEMADRFASAGYSATEKLYIANEVFGRSGSRMVELLNQGGAALEGQFAEMEKYGLMTEEQARASEAYNDSLTRMRSALDGLTNSVGAKLLPVLTEAVKKLTDDFVKNRDKYMKALEPIIDSIPSLVESFTNAVPGILSAIGIMMKAVGKLVDWFGVKWPLVAVVAGSVVAPLAATVAAIAKILWMPVKTVLALGNYFGGSPGRVKSICGRVLGVMKSPFARIRGGFGFLFRSLPRLGVAVRGVGMAFKSALGPLGLLFTAFEIWKPTLELVWKNLDMIKSVTFDDLTYCVKELDKSFDGLRRTLADIPFLGKIFEAMGGLAANKVDFSGIGGGDIGSLMEEASNPSIGASRSGLFGTSTTKTINRNTSSVIDVKFSNVPDNVRINRHDYSGARYGSSMQPAF